MRKVSMFAAATLLAAPVLAQAASLDDLLAENKSAAPSQGQASDVKVYYKNGTHLDFGNDFDMTIKLQMKTLYTYSDIDGGQDSNDFRVQQARLDVKGNIADKQFSYRLENDFASNTDPNTGRRGSELKDVWFQYNADDLAHIRMGQYKVPFIKQWVTSDANLQFIDRSIVSNYFSPSRNQGVMITSQNGLGAINECYGYALGVFNGDSKGEGANRTGVDPNLLGAASAYYNYNAYDRNSEGDPENTQDFQLTIGASGLYGQGHEDYTSDLPMADFDEWGATGDLGIKYAGLSAQSEIVYRNLDFTDINGPAARADEYGVYGQVGYFVVPEKLELAGRFGWIKGDKDVNIADDVYEYSAVVGYYVRGHSLKIQTGPSWIHTNYADKYDDTTDFRYQFQVAGYF